MCSLQIMITLFLMLFMTFCFSSVSPYHRQLIQGWENYMWQWSIPLKNWEIQIHIELCDPSVSHLFSKSVEIYPWWKYNGTFFTIYSLSVE